MSIRRGVFLCLGLLFILLSAAGLSAQTQDPASLWADFNHYVRIARPDLAQASAQALLQLEPARLLDVVEASDYRDDFQITLTRAEKTEGLTKVAQQLDAAIQGARIARAREPKRIIEDIHKLAGGARENANATERLRAAGQFAAPYLLAALLDDNEAVLHPHVLAAMVAIGRPMVYPLAVALPSLPARPMRQTAAVLAEIGYPRALPYMKQIIEDPAIDPDARAVVQTAFNKLAERLSVANSLSSAQLFLTLGENYYSLATRTEDLPGFDSAQNKGIVWDYLPDSGLLAIPVPGPIFGDVLAMRAAHRALTLNPKMDKALSLWLMANLRRQQRLPAGQQDPSYPATLQPPAYYLKMAGPVRQHDVLAKALDDNDATLAMAAINALSETAGADALINRQGSIQPLLRALYYPDRQVRIHAALVLVQARPTQAFPGSDRVVHLLCEAIRPYDSRTAIIIAPDQESLNKLMVAVKDMGFAVIGGKSLDDVNKQVSSVAGVDVIVTKLPADMFATTFLKLSNDFRLASLPTVEVANAHDEIELNRQYDGQSRRPLVLSNEDPKALKHLIDAGLKATAGEAFSAAEADTHAMASLKALYEIALSHSPIFNPQDAQPTLIHALSDARPQVVVEAAKLLALNSSPDAQHALADAAFDPARPAEQRLALLQSLAASAVNFGNQLNDNQIDKLMTLVKTSQGDTALIAARIYGALTLPTSNVVQLITDKK